MLDRIRNLIFTPVGKRATALTGVVTALGPKLIPNHTPTPADDQFALDVPGPVRVAHGQMGFDGVNAFAQRQMAAGTTVSLLDVRTQADVVVDTTATTDTLHAGKALARLLALSQLHASAQPDGAIGIDSTALVPLGFRIDKAEARWDVAGTRQTLALDSAALSAGRVSFKPPASTTTATSLVLRLMSADSTTFIVPVHLGPSNANVPDPLGTRLHTAVGPGVFDGTLAVPEDMAQGYIGDCYALATAVALVDRDPEGFASRAVQIDAHRFWFRFDEQLRVQGMPRVPVWVLVDTDENHGARTVVRPDVEGSADTIRVVWPVIFEKAWSLFAREGDYRTENGGNTSIVLTALGVSPRTYAFANYSDDALLALFASKKILTAATYATIDTAATVRARTLVGGHAYAVLGADTEREVITLFNPWGRRVEITVPELRTYFSTATGAW